MKKMILAGAAMGVALGIGFTAGAQNNDADTPLAIVEAAPESAWRTLDPENTLYMDLPSGRMVIELRPDFAPAHVERIKTLTRQGFYNGTIFHRVIEGFMAQGGDPTGTGRGGSDFPNLQAEFMHDRATIDGLELIGRDRRTARIGFIGPIPVGTQPETLSDFLVSDGIALWGMHCRGVMSMARAGDPNSANSQFFVMFDDSRRSLDQRYTVWGKIVDGFENARRINRGEPPDRPTPINRMLVAADVPPAERVDVKVMRTDSDAFHDYLRSTRAVTDQGFVDDVCSITVPAKVNGEIEF